MRVVPQDDPYTMEWKTEIDSIFENPRPDRNPHVIESKRDIKISIPNNDNRNLTNNPVIHLHISRDVGRSKVLDQKSDLISESHTKVNQVQLDPTNTTLRR